MQAVAVEAQKPLDESYCAEVITSNPIRGHIIRLLSSQSNQWGMDTFWEISVAFDSSLNAGRKMFRSGREPNRL